MLSVLYEDKDIIVVKKPAGVESQTAKGFAPDMVSEIRRYLAAQAAQTAAKQVAQMTGQANAQEVRAGQQAAPKTAGASTGKDIHKLATNRCTTKNRPQEAYVGVIHRLDKPVAGIMVYAKNQKAAAALSSGLQKGEIQKFYMAVICGKPVDNQGIYVDYLLQDRKNNCSGIVDKSTADSRRAELRYEVVERIEKEENGETKKFSLVKIELLTGRHHQIRVQFSGHGTPLFGDGRYGCPDRRGLALCACRLSFKHPSTGKIMNFEITPAGGAFDWFTSLKPSHGSSIHP